MKKIFTATSFLLVLALLPVSAHASPKFDYSDLGRVSILHDGRIKPLDTFARIHLLAFYGRNSMPDQSAMGWLVELLFDQTSAYRKNVFDISDPSVVDALDLERRQQHKYSFLELSRAFEASGDAVQQILAKKDEERTATQTHLLEVYGKFISYVEISRSLSAFLPEFLVKSEKLARELDVTPGERLSFRELMKQSRFSDIIRKRTMSKSDDLTSEEKKEVSELAIKLDRASQDLQTEIFRIIPPQWEQSQDIWLSPAALISSGLGSPASGEYLGLWRSLYDVYRAGEPTIWKEVSRKINAESKLHSEPFVRSWKINLEYLYNRLDLFTRSLAVYITALLSLFLSWMFWHKRLSRLNFWLLGIGATFHTVGLVMRMVIMNRPPVATLYESIVFVGLIAVMLGLILERTRGNGLGVLIGALSGAMLQFVGMRYETSGDTMGMLVAVLDTNFWLATHVVTITIGYGGCLVAGLIGHLYLLLTIIKPRDSDRANELSKNMLGISLVALFFALFGTILGGIWADQSWGRFWGWDPKENGALLIVLWLIFLLHGRTCGLIGKIGFAAGMVITNVIVALAWFGVNLLNVGLHSYGFTGNVAFNLAVFCGVESLFAIITYAMAKQREYLLTAKT